MTMKEQKNTLLAMQLPSWYSSRSSFSASEIVLFPRVMKELTDVNEAMLIGDWGKGVVYSSFGNQLAEGSKSIVKYNGDVYVCSSNNIENLKNQSNASNYPPSSGILEDGYQWVKIFQIDVGEWGASMTVFSFQLSSNVTISV